MKYVILIIVLPLFALFGCQTPSRYTMEKDSAPVVPYKEPDMADAVAYYEPYREINQQAYRVMGRSYTPLKTGKGYIEEGGASWYGQKFHGHLTANGETYDMFAMTAAHRTLPLPSFVKVTNLDNGTTAVVRVNDRGPFHSDRIIDLSYAAAKKLRFHQKGTARVKLETIYVDKDQSVTVGNSPPLSYADYLASLHPTDRKTASSPAPVFIQVAALADAENARQVSMALSSLYQVPTEMPLIENIYRLRLGPLHDAALVTELLETLKRNGYPNAYTITASM